MLRTLAFGLVALVVGVSAVVSRVDAVIAGAARDFLGSVSAATSDEPATTTSTELASATDTDPTDADPTDADSTSTTVDPDAPPERLLIEKPLYVGPCLDAYTAGAWGGTDFFGSIGMTKFQVEYYGNSVPDTSERGLADAAALLDRHPAISLDIEDLSNRGWQTEGIDDVSRAAASYGLLARELNERSGTPFAFYGTLPIFDYYNALDEQGPNNRWSLRNDVIAAEIIDHVDYLSPVGYLHTTDIDTELRKLRNLAAESRRVADGKPVILYLSAEIQGLSHADSNRFRALDYDSMSRYLDTVAPLFDGILFWGWANGGGSAGLSRPFDDGANAGWQQALTDYMAAGGCRQYR